MGSLLLSTTASRIPHQLFGCMMASGLPPSHGRKCLQRFILTSAKLSGFDLTEMPLMRCDPLQPKLAHLLAECAHPPPVISSLSRAFSHRPLPTAVRFHRKRTFTVAHPEHQEELERRLTKRARKNDTKRRRLLWVVLLKPCTVNSLVTFPHWQA